MISTNDFHSGLTIEIDGQAYLVIESMHVKPGKGGAFVRTKLKNLETGVIIDKTFDAGVKVPTAMVEKREMQYLYNDGDGYVLMDTENYEQIHVPGESLGDRTKFLKEQMLLNVSFWKGQPIDFELPHTVELAVVDTDPGLRGDTASGGTKPATLETGAVIRVPLFVEKGDLLKVDTRTGNYISRA